MRWLGQLQLEYFSGKAKVPLFGFRRAFGQVNALVYSAKKQAKSQPRQAGRSPGASYEPQSHHLLKPEGRRGKSHLTRELGIYLSTLGHRVLLVDCDPQGNLTKGRDGGPDGGLYRRAQHRRPPAPVKLTENLSLYAGDFRLAVLEKNLIGEIDAYTPPAYAL